jgi:heme exporter protein A
MEGRNHSMSPFSLTISGLTKEFSRRSIFRDVSSSLAMGDSLAITGRNGSGKSTLVKIICGLLSPTKGTIEFKNNGSTIPTEEVRNHIGFVSPYLQLYDEFSGIENLELLSTIRSDDRLEQDRMEQLLNEVGLWERRHDFVRTYSSGMKQRLKYAFAVMHRPALLVLDEPTSNLDKEGVAMVKSLVARQKKNAILVVATNDAREAVWCKKRIELGTPRS